MAWHAQLDLHLQCDGQGRTVARHVHDGPLRILKSLYPEGGAICHNVLVHPPGGLVGGDTLSMRVKVDAGAHGLVTTPGATRFYRSLGEPARQQLSVHLQAGARLEWLPLEAIAYPECLAENQAEFVIEPGAEMMAWDITALGLPEAGQAFQAGQFRQHLSIPGVWLEAGEIHASDTLLMDSPLGLAGHRCLGTLVFAAGQPISRDRQEEALDRVRSVLAEHSTSVSAGATSPHPQVLVIRTLAPRTEPVLKLLQQAWACWRESLWGLSGQAPRLWRL
jgi:urease accessory protein